MKFSVIPLIKVSGVNDFLYSTQVEFTAGDATDIYVQLVDLEKNSAQYGYYPGGLRYVPLPLSTVQVTIRNIDTAKEFIRYATQPFATDASIWRFSLLPTDPVSGTLTIHFVLTEPGTPATTKTTEINALLQGKSC
jgi:hypothetical protein